MKFSGGMTSLYIEEKINKVKKLHRYFCSPYLLHRFQMDLQSLIHKNQIKLIIHASGVNTHTHTHTYIYENERDEREKNMCRVVTTIYEIKKHRSC